MQTLDMIPSQVLERKVVHSILLGEVNLCRSGQLKFRLKAE